MRDAELFVARTNGVLAISYDPTTGALADKARPVAELPGGRGHSSRSLAVGPDGKLYVNLGITDNCSDEYIGGDYTFKRRRGGVMVLDESVTPPRWQPFATGLRNPVGFD